MGSCKKSTWNLYYFVKLHLNLQLSKNEMFYFKNGFHFNKDKK